MIDKEVSELRRRFKYDRSAITKVYGCYVNQTGEVITEFAESMGMLPQAAQEKYLELLKKAISGTIGKTLTDVVFSTAQVADSDEHRLLMKLRESACADEEARAELFEKITKTLHFDENYLILLAADTYDVPYRGDSCSGDDTQFSYIICSICPVKEVLSVLHFDVQAGSFENRPTERVVGAPNLGFLFPAFDERATNLYGALYYTKGGKGSYDELFDAVFHTKPPMPVPEQQETFRDVLTDALEDECRLPVVQAVHTGLREMVALHKEAKIAEPLAVSREEIGAVLQSSGVTEQKLAAFNVQFDSAFGTDSQLPPQNLLGTNKLEYKTPYATIKLDPERQDLISLRTMGGAHYLVLNVDEGVALNDVNLQFADEA